MSSFPYIHYTKVLAMLYLGMAFAIIGGTNLTLDFMLHTGIRAEAFVIILSAFAALLLTKPSLKWLLLCILPMALYEMAMIASASDRGSPLLAVNIVFAVTLITAQVAYYRLKEWKAHNIYGALTIVLGMAVLSSPALGASGWIQSNLGVQGVVIGATLTLGGCLLILLPSWRVFLSISSLLTLYSTSAIVSTLQAGNVVTACVYAVFAVTIFYTSVKARRIYGVGKWNY